MAVNVSTRTDADDVKIFLRNYAYSSAVTDMDNLNILYMTDQDRLGYKGGDANLKDGTVRKLAEEANSSGNIPENVILFTNSDGRITYNSDLSYDDVNGRIVCTNGIDLGNGFTIETTVDTLSIKHSSGAIGLEFPIT